MEKGQIERFTIDFLYIKERNTTIKNCTVQFYEKNQYIEINGDTTYFDPFYIKDDGLSSDCLYYKIFTPLFAFWVNPMDYQRLLNVIKFKQELQFKKRQLRKDIDRLNAENTIEFDDIDEDIYNYFIAHKSGLCAKVGTWNQVNRVEKAIELLCIKNNGIFYKNETRKARFAIIFNPAHCVYTIISAFREKGFKVTSFEKVVTYFNLKRLFNVDMHIQHHEEMKKYIGKTY